MAEVSRARVWPAAIRSLRHRDFRLLWIGLVISAVGTWMQIVAQSLLVLQITHGSAFALGLVSLVQALAFFLFALLGGGIADRLDRRRLLLFTQSSLMVMAAIMGWLTQTGHVRLWMVVVQVFFAGAVLSFDQPTRAALVSTLVPQEDLLNAISLQSAVFNGASTIGPALAGITVDAIGLPANFYLNALSFLAVLWSLLAMRRLPGVARGLRSKLFGQIREALGTVRRDAVLPSMLLNYGTVLFFGPSLALLLPVLAIDRLHVSAGVLGILFSGAGLGAVAGALVLAGLSPESRKSRLLFGCFALWVVSLLAVGFSTVVVVSFTALVAVGFSQSIIGALTSTALQVRVPAQQRGRVMSLNTLLIMGVRPLGDFPAGSAIGLWGVPTAVVGSAAVVGCVALYSYLRHPRLRTL